VLTGVSLIFGYALLGSTWCVIEDTASGNLGAP
jgi:hypothetical protein